MRLVSTHFLILVLFVGLGSCGFFDTIAGWFGANEEGSDDDDATTALQDGEVFAPTTEGTTKAGDDEKKGEGHSKKAEGESPGETTEKGSKDEDDSDGKETTTKSDEHGEDKSEDKEDKKDSKEKEDDDDDDDKDDESKKTSEKVVNFRNQSSNWCTRTK